MKNKQYLLLTTKDSRKFLTHIKNHPQLIEFSKTFGAEISVIRAKLPNLPILDLEALAPAICSPNYCTPKTVENLEYHEKENSESTRKQVIKNAKKIREYIEKKFISGHTVGLHEINKAFQKQNLSLCTISNHIRCVRMQLSDNGHTIEKIGAGQYKLKK